MRGWCAVAGTLILICAGRGSAQPFTPAIPPVPLPTMLLPADQPLPGGSAVSQPLQPIEIPPPGTLPPITEPPSASTEVKLSVNERDAKACKILGDWWDSDELLIWWPKAQPLPPLVTGSRGAAPVLGASTTALLIGNHTITTQDIEGYRLTHGWSLNSDDTLGFEGRFFFLGTRTNSLSFSDSDRNRTIGLPYLNALTGQEDAVPLARPGLSSTMVTVSTSTRLLGFEANFLGNLYAKDGVKVHAIAGYRYFQANEGLNIQSQWLQYPTADSGYLKTLGMIADQIDAHNEFHGGQVGLMADAHRGMFYVEVTGKAAIGTNFEMVRLDGQTNLITAAYPVPNLQSFHGGIYTQGSNIGQYTKPVFAVVPEGTCKVGLKFGDRGRFYFGYNFLYLSNAVRPGDQIDRTINPLQIPLVGRGTQIVGPDRPQVAITRSDFWTQGLVIGFETRF